MIRRLKKLLGLLRDAVAAAFGGGIRLNFVNFWLIGESARSIWFFPLVEDLLRVAAPGRELKISEFRPHIEFFSLLGESERLKKSRAPIRVFFSGECVRPVLKSDWTDYGDYRLSLVDLALGFDPEDEVASDRYLRFPLWILYLFSRHKNKDEIVATIKAINEARYPKSRFCAIIARHDKSGVRAAIVDALRQIQAVDSAGSWMRNDESLEREFGDDKLAYLRRYRFTICPENRRGRGYVTEKLFHAFQARCLPIYSGYDSAPEPAVIDERALLFWREGEANEDLIQRVIRLNEDRQEYERFLAIPPFKDTAADFVWERIESLKARLATLLERLSLREKKQAFRSQG